VKVVEDEGSGQPMLSVKEAWLIIHHKMIAFRHNEM